MQINGQTVMQIIITASDGEVLAVVADDTIIEKKGVSVIVDFG